MVYNDNTLSHWPCFLSELGFGGVCDGKSKYSGQVKCLAGHQDTSAEISTVLPDSGRLTGMQTSPITPAQTQKSLASQTLSGKGESLVTLA